MLTYEEFCELLDRVIKTPLHEMDPNLIPLVNLSVSWYQGLAQVLCTKYRLDSRRKFCSPDGHVQYHVGIHCVQGVQNINNKISLTAYCQIRLL